MDSTLHREYRCLPVLPRLEGHWEIWGLNALGVTEVSFKAIKKWA